MTSMQPSSQEHSGPVTPTEIDRAEEFRIAVEAISSGDGTPAHMAEAIDALGRTTARDVLGECTFGEIRYCRFYGEDPPFCDRSCAGDVWDQI